MKKASDLNDWIDEIETLCQPDLIHWCDGSDEEYDRLIEQAVEEGKATRLNESKRPGSVAFFSDPQDVARVEERTFIASLNEKDAGPTNHWIDPVVLKKTMTTLFEGSMKGRTMYVIPFVMGPLNSPLRLVGIQVTDSIYVTVNMKIMTRMGRVALDILKETDQFVPCLHSVGAPLEPGEQDVSWPAAPLEDKFIAHFPEEHLIWSYGSGYGGNALLGKKCLALRIASKMAKDQGWMAEHMLIMKVTSPEGNVKYMAGAFPSACGKTNLSMLVPGLKGWTVETIGDDIAWLKIGKDGRLWAINPENGFFGVAKGTSYTSNPNAMKALERDTIFTNVALTDDLDVWWEGIDGSIPAHLTDWQGHDWTPDSKTPAAHPNSRFTTMLSHCPVLADEWNDGEGVPISAILIGGRRPSTIPLVHESKDFEHGIFMGSMMGSEITAASLSKLIGHVRRDPFAMLPFIGYHVGDYLAHWFEMKRMTDEKKLPRIYFVNWFKKDSDGQFLWPGFGENIRVLKWIFERIDGVTKAIDTPIGGLPDHTGIDTDGLGLKDDVMAQLLNVNANEWLVELASIRSHYQRIGEKLPIRLQEILEEITDGFEKC
ncbi:MAG: phosphoenolpyruvate carboxykinase (GTP) [Acholeplasmataceae bacterium]|nr:phosphoenolpyruvate carboxykinase (GTP) [Acholeplasmataceae bacterium]